MLTHVLYVLNFLHCEMYVLNSAIASVRGARVRRFYLYVKIVVGTDVCVAIVVGLEPFMQFYAIHVCGVAAHTLVRVSGVNKQTIFEKGRHNIWLCV